jgi:Amt family ammonium transporter
MFTEWSSRGKPTVLGAASGAVAGLVAITPAAGFVTPLASIVIGAVAGIICYTACNFKTKLGYDDSPGCGGRARGGRHLGRAGHGASSPPRP